LRSLLDFLGSVERKSRPTLHRKQPDRRSLDMIAPQTLAVYLALQRHFISGLTLGATKG
jgi:hypothetical protein